MTNRHRKTIIVTGGAGFIGSALVRYLIQYTDYNVVNIDKLTYAGNLLNIQTVSDSERYFFEQVDITNSVRVNELFAHYQPAGIMHLAAESHVDRSIDGPAEFIQTNINGTYNLLEAAREYQKKLSGSKTSDFRFLHVSTDEVYGQLGDTGYFSEETPYDPHSPYSASKASSDHLARAWFHTFDLPVLVTNCSNNYGPYQFPEKLIPVVILKALAGQEIPVYGKGENVRDWLYVEDHVRALLTVFEKGEPGETYNIGGNNEQKNIDVVKKLTSLLDEMKPTEDGKRYAEQISFVTDRPGHDWRYAIDAGKIKKELGWEPSENFESGMRKTVEWYLNNIKWCEAVTDKNYGLERLGKIEG